MRSNVDKSAGIIYLHGEVDVDMYGILARGISDLGANQYLDSITLVLNTEGGDLYQALAIYDLIRLQQITKPIKVLCCGPVMSAGIVIMCAAEERVAMPHTQFMIHYGEEYNDAPSSVKHNKHLFGVMKDIVKARVNVSKRKLSSWFNQDTYLTANDALQAGLVTRITK